MDSVPPGTDLCAIPAGPSPDGSPPNFDNPVSLTTTTIAVSCVMLYLTTVFVSARVWINWGQLKWSDYFTMIAFVLQAGFTGIILSLSKFDRHLWDVPACWMTPSYLKRLYAHSLLFGMTLFFSKAAIFLLYLEIFGTTRKMRRFIYGGLTFAALLYVTFIPMISLYSAPPAGQSWDVLLAQMADLNKARPVLLWSLAIGSGSTLLDFYIFVLPLPIVRRLHTSRKKRLQLTAVFGTALLGVVASIVALAYRVYLITDSLDGTWHQASVAMANMIENNVAIIVGSMPAFHHFIRSCVGETKLWKSIASIFDTMRAGKSTHDSIREGRVWPPSSSKRPYNLHSHPPSGGGFELIDSRGAMKSSVVNVCGDYLRDDGLEASQHGGDSSGGITRTVDIFQQTQQRPGSSDPLV